jgi:hypothetical protein
MRRWKIAFALLVVASATAWGWSPPYEDHRGIFLSSEVLTAAVDCHDGEETFTVPLLLAEGRGRGWIFAIPGRAADVRAAFLAGRTYVEGQWPTQQATERIAGLRDIAALTQIYPVVWELFRPSLSRTQTLPTSQGRVVRSNGLRCEIFDANTEADLVAGVQRSGVMADQKELHQFAGAVDRAHCFVTVEQETPQVPAGEPLEREFASAYAPEVAATLQLSFPSAVPVLPAALRDYAPAGGRANVVVRGYQRPLTQPEHARWAVYTGTQERCGHQRTDTVEAGIAYTRMTFPTQWPMAEIRFAPEKGIRLRMAEGASAMTRGPLGAGVLLGGIAALSYLSGGLAGLIVFRRWRAYATLGLWNFLTIVAVWIRAGTGGRSNGSEKLANRFALCFSAIYLVLCHLLTEIITRLWAGNPVG